MKALARVHTALQLLPPMTITDLARCLCVHRDRVDDAIRTLTAHGVVERAGRRKPRGRRPHYLWRATRNDH